MQIFSSEEESECVNIFAVKICSAKVRFSLLYFRFKFHFPIILLFQLFQMHIQNPLSRLKQIFKIDFQIVNDFQPLTIFAK